MSEEKPKGNPDPRGRGGRDIKASVPSRKTPTPRRARRILKRMRAIDPGPGLRVLQLVRAHHTRRKPAE